MNFFDYADISKGGAGQVDLLILDTLYTVSPKPKNLFLYFLLPLSIDSCCYFPLWTGLWTLSLKCFEEREIFLPIKRALDKHTCKRIFFSTFENIPPYKKSFWYIHIILNSTTSDDFYPRLVVVGTHYFYILKTILLISFY